MSCLFCDILLNLLESVMFSLIKFFFLVSNHNPVSLGKIKLNPGYFIVQNSWILNYMKSFIESSSNLNYSLRTSHQNKPLKLFDLSMFILLLESRK